MASAKGRHSASAQARCSCHRGMAAQARVELGASDVDPKNIPFREEEGQVFSATNSNLEYASGRVFDLEEVTQVFPCGPDELPPGESKTPAPRAET